MIKRFFSSFEWTIAWRYLRSRRRDGFISVIAGFSFLGIMLGVATLIVVMAVMNGFRQELMSKILGVNGHAFIQPYGDALTDYDAIAKRVSAAKGVKIAAPIIEGQVLAASPSATSGALVRGVREADLKRFDSVAKNVIEGTLNGLDGSEKVAIGRRLAGYLNLGVGDKIRLLSPKGPSTPFGSAPRQKSYEIAAIFEVGMSEFDASFIFMPLAEAQLYFDSEGKVAMIEVFVDNPDRMDDVSPAIREAVGKPHALTDWRFRNRTFFGALEVERNVMFLILTMIVLVAALNIISGLTMLVKDKARALPFSGPWGDAALDSGHLHDDRRGDWRGRNLCRLPVGADHCLECRKLAAAGFLSLGLSDFPARAVFPLAVAGGCPPTEVIAIVTMALTLSLLATLYPPGGRQSWIRLKLCGGSESMAAPALQMANVSRAYRQGDNVVSVLTGVDLTLQPGEMVALVAPSGSGNRPCCISPGCSKSRIPARSLSVRPRRPAWMMARGRGSAGMRSASSISSTICSANSPRWRM